VRTSTDCASRAEECRRLAKLAAKPEDCQHFLEMAATWDMLANQRPSDKLAETCALAEAIANGRNLGLQKRASVNQMIVPAMSVSALSSAARHLWHRAFTALRMERLFIQGIARYSGG